MNKEYKARSNNIKHDDKLSASVRLLICKYEKDMKRWGREKERAYKLTGISSCLSGLWQGKQDTMVGVLNDLKKLI